MGARCTGKVRALVGTPDPEIRGGSGSWEVHGGDYEGGGPLHGKQTETWHGV